jgi:alkaline phosphatase
MQLKALKKAALCALAAFLAATFVFSSAQAAVGGDKTVKWTGARPKYVFMFIADGLSYSQLSIASAYLGALEGKVQAQDLTTTKFPVAGSAATYDSTSFAPDSASTATSYATGFKTLSGVINMDETKQISYETITEKLKKQLGWKVGVVSTVNLNHATPAAYYGHQPSRGNYYELSKELVKSGFDYFAGGKLLDSRKGEFDRLDVYNDLKAQGYTVATTTAEFKALKAADKKLAIFSDDRDFSDDSGSMAYAIDRKNGQPTLADYVQKGVDVLNNDIGFFLMVEGGKIDWASHANDASTVINDVLAFEDAVKVAVKFYNERPKETLIIATGDHETGGLSIGFAGTAYDTHLELLAKQKISFQEYDKQVKKFRAEKTPFTEVMASVKTNFGLIAKDDADANDNPLVTLTDYQLNLIQAAYQKSMIDPAQRVLSESESLLYGSYEPLSVTLTHILNQKAGVAWTSYSHTGVPVPVFAMGAGQELFSGYYDNTQVFYNLKALTNVK